MENIKLYWYLVSRKFDGKMFVMRGNTKPNNWFGLSGLFALTTDKNYCFETPFGSVRNVSSCDYDDVYYTIVKKVEAED